MINNFLIKTFNLSFYHKVHTRTHWFERNSIMVTSSIIEIVWIRILKDLFFIIIKKTDNKIS